MAAALIVFMLAVPTIASALPALTADRSPAADLFQTAGAGRPFALTRISAAERAERALPRSATRKVTHAPVVVAPSAGSHGAGYSTGSGRANWYAIAACESGGNWATNTGNGYWGGLQFSPGTWYANGGGPFNGSGPFPYSAGQQIAVAERVLASQGPGAWPHCFAWA
ncbi:MAG: transglycosylase family protein [Actinomycetota bacterium]